MEPDDLGKQMEQLLQGLRTTIAKLQRVIQTLEQTDALVNAGNNIERRIDTFLGGPGSRN